MILLKRILFLTTLKQPLWGHKTYLNMLMPLIGFFDFAQKRIIDKISWPLLAIAIYSLCSSLFALDQVSIIRNIQFLGIALFFNYLTQNLNESDFVFNIRGILYVSVVILVLEAFLFGPSGWTDFHGQSLIPRFSGIVGEPNFSAVLIFGSLLIYLKLKKYLESVILIILGIFTGSRTLLVCYVLLISIYLIRYNKKLHSLFNKITLFCLILSPLIIGITSSQLTIDQKKSIDRIVSNRLGIQSAYLEVFIDHPWGIGNYKSLEVLEANREKYITPQYAQPHNLFIQILVEFGILGYFFWITFLFMIFKKLEIDKLGTSFFLSLIFYFTTLNGLNEFILYFLIAFLLNQVKLKKAS